MLFLDPSESFVGDNMELQKTMEQDRENENKVKLEHRVLWPLTAVPAFQNREYPPTT